MPSSTLFLAPLPLPFSPPKQHLNNNIFIQENIRNRNVPKYNKFVCKSSSSSSASWILDLDLYELLGVDSSSDQSEIKKAYRSLQKRCHPDIAGPAGHDMAIILNQVYSLLSDPNSRYVYDQEQAKVSEFKGYTGKPLYSTWFGHESEHRAVFVDEVKCVGCLKCALHAKNTFAIESVYGRARAIAQWADPEDKIVDAIQTCPVDCISMVDRSDLAALEFLMSKLPRGNARAARGTNIFADVNKFKNRFYEMNDRASEKESKEAEHEKNSRMSAIRGIRSFTDWFYWHSPSDTKADTNIVHIQKSTIEPDTERIRQVAAKLKSLENAPTSHAATDEEYWTPMLTLPSGSVPAKSPEEPPQRPKRRTYAKANTMSTTRKWSLASLSVPLVMAAVAVGAVGGGKYGEFGVRHLDEHVAGTAALEVVNSFELQVVLAGVTWFVIGLGIVGVFEMLGVKDLFRR